MDLLYQEFSSKLRKSTQELVKDSDEKDRYSALMDARMTALRQQNKVCSDSSSLIDLSQTIFSLGRVTKD
jgi:hypothetical protein